MKEIWKDIDGYKDYQVSNMGRLKSLKFNRETILKQGVQNCGYRNIQLYNDRVRKGLLVHRLVAIAFVPNPENKAQVNHINGIKTDNNSNNLEWCTASYNLEHAKKEKLNKCHSESHYRAMLTNDQVVEIRKMLENGLKPSVVASMFNQKVGNIYKIKNYQIWKRV